VAGEIGFKIILQFVASVVTRPRPAFGGTATRDENRCWALPVDVLRATAFRTLLFVGTGIASGLVGAIAALCFCAASSSASRHGIRKRSRRARPLWQLARRSHCLAGGPRRTVRSDRLAAPIGLGLNCYTPTVVRRSAALRESAKWRWLRPSLAPTLRGRRPIL